MKAFVVLKKIWLKFAEIVEKVGSTIILGLIFYTIIAVYNIFYRFFGLFKNKKVSSRWDVFEHNQHTMDDLTKEF